MPETSGIVVRRYNPKDTTITFDGYSVTGFADEMVTTSKDEEFFEPSVGAQGDVVINEVNNQLGTVSVTIQATSPSKYALVKAARDRVIAPLWVTNKTIGVKKGGAHAQIKNYPEDALSTTAGDLTFEWQVFDYDETPLEVDDLVVDTRVGNA